MSPKPLDTRKWYQKKRFIIPTAAVGLTLALGGGSSSVPTNSQSAAVVVPEVTTPTLKTVSTDSTVVPTDTEKAKVPATTPVVPKVEPVETVTTKAVAPTPTPAPKPVVSSETVVTPATPAVKTTTDTQESGLSNNNYYTNVDGQSIHSPAYSNSGAPTGASAECRDGTYSFSTHHSGTCSHHGGVASWL
jgi:hypothetical protein